MSGIAGIWSNEDEALDPRWLPEMLRFLDHRGPHGACAWFEGQVALGQLLLRTSEATPDPHRLEELRGRDLVICADARLDNRQELVAELPAQRTGPAAITDARLILLAYERWGSDCPLRLLGDFAFAIWDRRERVLFGARDRFGIRPFYYTHGPGQRFAFASELKALFRLPWVGRRRDDRSVAAYLMSFYEDKASTFYEDLRRLPPATRIRVDPRGIQCDVYWKLDPERQADPASSEECAEGFLERFRAAVGSRVDEREPLAFALSGGLDSTAVTCMARALLPLDEVPELLTISATFEPGSPADEQRFVDVVTDQPGYRSIRFRADPLGPLEDIDRVLEIQDEPFFAPNHFLLWKVMQCAQEAGARVLIDGHDGDSTVSHGLWRLHELARQFRLPTLLREIRGLGSYVEALRPPWRKSWRYLLEDGIRPRVPPPLRRLLRPLRRRRPTSSEESFLHPDLLPRTGLDAEIRELRSAISAIPKTARREHFLQLDQGFIPFAFEVVGRSAAHFGLEPRYPFCDSRLVEYCLSLPADQKLDRGLTRVVMRRALRGIVPDASLRRPDKADLSHNFNRALLERAADPLRDLLLDDPGPLRPYIDPAQLGKVHERFLRNPGSHDALILWRTLTLALWLRREPPVAARGL